MAQDKWIERGKNVIMNTYNRFPITLSDGEGVYLKDIDGKKYLDFVSGIAVNSLGYKNQTLINALYNQMKNLIHCSNLYWNIPNIEAAEILIKNSIFDKVFFCNSGAEAVESAIKLARKYGKKFHGEDCYEIITMKQSFHGRTMGAITATGQSKYQKDLNPLLDGILYAEYNNFESVKKIISNKTCAILLEPIQGEGGIRPADKEFLKNIRELCDEKNILLMYDEVQCGIGRTGYLFAYEAYEVFPDVICLAKGLGGGFPIGAMMANKKCSSVFQPGDHASTFGGNPAACTAAKIVLNTLINDNILKNVKEQGKYLREKLLNLKEKFNIIIDVRGIGLMQGIELSIPIGDIIKSCIEKGLLLVGAGSNVIRFVPPLIIKENEINEAIDILEEVLKGV
ncbi:aspartate aminotransferase family protein [Defluviitalea phaphyphila]|uniref:aspartate aminotransferase family protein n=1 Tax=Defluviitalea phaphyphila TaxID=1473580 RepID=UPI000731374D|nr:aspartate aminotransferase family protein [Defluviitalea phaphyphila]